MSERLVRYAALTGYQELAGALGLDARRLMGAVGLDVDEAVFQDKWIPAAAVARLLEVSARKSGCEDFGVRMSVLRRLSALGPISLVVREEPDLRSSLDLLIRYEHAYNGVLDARLVADDRLARVEVWLDFEAPVPVRQSVDLTAAGVVGIIRMLVGAQWSPLTACFAHPAPADLSQFHSVFGSGLRFDHAFTGMVFPARDLALPVIGADPTLRSYTQRFLRAAPREPRNEDQVRRLLEVLLPAGRATTAHVGRALAVRPRTLHRRLAMEGSSFSAILHTTRVTLAERYLANDRYSLTDISGMLGFSAPSAFSTWFRSQFGTTPSGWRTRTATPAETETETERRG